MSEQKHRRLGLALAGGVARGIAHVGVIQVLEEAGIEADLVSGVSAGSIVGACYAAGMSGAQLAQMAREIRWRKLARPAFLNPFRRGRARLGLVDFYNLELMLIHLIGDLTFAELRRPLAIGATDLVTGEPVTITSGRVAAAVRASSSMPGLVVPARRGKRLLCDGFVSNNLPIQVLREMGAEVVVAVNIIPLAGRPPSNPFWAGNAGVSNLILRSGDAPASADLLIEPDLAEVSYLRLDAADLIARGRAAAEPLLPRLRALLRT